MGRRSTGLLLGATWLMVLALAALSQPAAAVVTPCTTTDASEQSGDVERTPAGTGPADSVTGFTKVDITIICVTETAESVLVTMSVLADVASGPTFSGSWSLTVNGTTLQATHSGGTAGGDGEFSANQIQFTLAKTVYPVGSTLPALAFSTIGTFVPTVGNVVTGTDSFTPTNLTYSIIGSRAPPGADGDGDGVDDRDEITNGTDPANPDTDGDGLTDGEEAAAGTDPNVKDSDGDTVEDGDEVDQGTNPNNRDTDDDGVDDGADATPTTPGKDTDGDGLDDDAEKNPRNPVYASSFGGGAPGSTDPNDNDTDDDGLSDGQEVNGDRGPRTDPNNRDTDGDGIDDRTELENGFDPTDAQDGGRQGGDGGDDGGGVSEAVITYLPMSGAALIIVILVCAGGILWRWG